jgi:hypothetical protein
MAAKKTSSTTDDGDEEVGRSDDLQEDPAKKSAARRLRQRRLRPRRRCCEEGSREEDRDEEDPGHEGHGQEGRPKKATKARRRRRPGQEGSGEEDATAKKAAAKTPRRRTAPAEKAPDEATEDEAHCPAKKTPARPPSPQAKRTASCEGDERDAVVAVERDVRASRDPRPSGRTKDGIAYTKDFDVKFLKAQRDELLARRAAELARATGSRTRRPASSKTVRWATCSSTTRAARATPWSSSAISTACCRPRPARHPRHRRGPRPNRAGTYGYSERVGPAHPARAPRGDPRDDRARRREGQRRRPALTHACTRRVAGPVAIASGVVLDQLTKHWAVTGSATDRVIDVVWTLRFNLAFNNGMAFGQARGFRSGDRRRRDRRDRVPVDLAAHQTSRLSTDRHGPPDRWRGRQPDRSAVPR